MTSVRYIEKYLEPGMKILDLAAGTGAYSVYFAEKGYDIVGVELIEKYTDKIRENI